MIASSITNCTIKQFPDFIRHSRAINNDSLKIEKIFPKIGLPNSKEKIDFKFDFENISPTQIAHNAIKKYLYDFYKCQYFVSDLKSSDLLKVSTILHIFEELSKRFAKSYGLSINNDIIKLENPILSFDGKSVLAKKNTNCFKLIKTLLELGQKYAKIDLVESKDIKSQLKNLQIVFSSDGIDGAWDIATMSMRGIKSCMRWEARQSKALIGSITDSCCGIIYLTNNAPGIHGSKMLFRALVRLVFDEIKNKPALIIDKLYSCFYKNTPTEYIALDRQVKQSFVQFLQNKLPNFTILQNDVDYFGHYSMPVPNNYEFLTEEERTYKDTPIFNSRLRFSNLEPLIFKYLKTNNVEKKLTKKRLTKKTKNKTASQQHIPF